MDRIDIIGLPGAGKTTLARKLIKKSNDKIFCDDVYSYIHFALKKTKNERLNYIKIKYISKIINRRVTKSILNKYLYAEVLNMLKENFEIYEHTLKMWDEIFTSESDTFKKTVSLEELLSVIKDLVLSDNVKSNKLFLSDESLSQKLHKIRRCDNEELKYAKKFIDVYPRPRAVIYLKVHVDIVFRQIMNRNEKLATSHIGLTKEQIYKQLQIDDAYFNKCSKILNNKGIKVFIYDENGDPMEDLLNYVTTV